MISLVCLACQLACAAVADDELPPGALQPPIAAGRYTFGLEEDSDLDDEPDNWVRRRGNGFPKYIPGKIDHTVGRTDSHSLRFDANGGAAIYYSKPIKVEGLPTLFFEGYVRTEGLKNDAALLSVSLLNHKRERVQRYVSVAATGTHKEWQRLRIGPIFPAHDVRFVVLGCHLQPGSGDRRDIGGRIWFDDLSLGRLPRLELKSNFRSHFMSEDEPVEVSCRTSGLDPGHEYLLELSLLDPDGTVVDSVSRPLEPDVVSSANRDLNDYLEAIEQRWEIPQKPPGFYRVRAVLHRDKTPLFEERTSLAVVRLVRTPRERGEFGWSLGKELPRQVLNDLPQVAVQAGINWLKYPVWNTMGADQSALSGDVAIALQQLSAQHIEPVGMLSEPPPEIRNQFARSWQGVSEVFHLPPGFWGNSLKPVVARYSSIVHLWQLGGDQDHSFVGHPALLQTLGPVRSELQKISLNASLGLPWPIDSQPPGPEARLNFVSVTVNKHPPAPTPPGMKHPMTKRWVVIRPSELPGDDTPTRAMHLIRALVAAKVDGAAAIYVDDVYHPQFGLLKPNGAPSELFLPWRTVVLALQGAKSIGSFVFPQRSPNAVFTHDGEAVVVVWNDEPTTESLYLGEQVVEVDIWGRQRPLPTNPNTGEQTLEVGPLPKLLLHCSEPVAHWRIEAGFDASRVRSEHGRHQDAIVGRNTFPQGVSGTVSLGLPLPPEWECEPREATIQCAAGESFRFPIYLTLSPNASLGKQQLMLDFQVTGDRLYRFRVYRDYEVGLGDVVLEVIDRKLPDGRLEIEQLVHNNTNPEQVFDFRCSLFVRDYRRQKLQVTKLRRGTDRKFYYLPDADRFRGQEMHLRLDQEGGRRILNHTWKIGADWDHPKPK